MGSEAKSGAQIGPVHRGQRDQRRVRVPWHHRDDLPMRRSPTQRPNTSFGLTEPRGRGHGRRLCALATGNTAMISLHTYPGLASGMFNIRNAQLAGIPSSSSTGPKTVAFLIHNPVSGRPQH